MSEKIGLRHELLGVLGINLREIVLEVAMRIEVTLKITRAGPRMGLLVRRWKLRARVLRISIIVMARRYYTIQVVLETIAKRKIE